MWMLASAQTPEWMYTSLTETTCTACSAAAPSNGVPLVLSLSNEYSTMYNGAFWEGGGGEI